MINCPSCEKAMTPSEFVGACSDFNWRLDTVQFTCPHCRKDSNARVEHGKLSLGYIYAAGSAHFCGVVEVRVDGLLAWRDGDDLGVELDDEAWKINASR